MSTGTLFPAPALFRSTHPTGRCVPPANDPNRHVPEICGRTGTHCVLLRPQISGSWGSGEVLLEGEGGGEEVAVVGDAGDHLCALEAQRLTGGRRVDLVPRDRRGDGGRSGERRVGKGGVRTCRSRWSRAQ